MSDWPYDADVLDEVARVLYGALPAMYRVAEGGEQSSAELRSLLEVLAGPLAVVRQSIHELHADLFVDTAHDRMVPYLAERLGAQLVFPDMPSNRRDVRGTVAWRRRKGTPPALEEMGAELMAQPVVLQEGWKRIQLAQDLDLVRPERVAPDVRPAVVAEQAAGPLDALFHTVDVRPITARTGRRHPRHVAHWAHTTVTFPLRGATAAERSVPGSDVRFAFDPTGGRHALRAAREAGDREPFVDRIEEQHFAARPDRWFGREGGFTVRVCGLPAAVAAPVPDTRVAATAPASTQLARGDVTLTALELPSRGWRGGVRVELGLATVTGAGSGAWRPNPATFAARAGIDLDAGGVAGASTTGGALPGGLRVPLLRLTPLDGAPGRFLPGVTLEIASAAPGSRAASAHAQLAREGFLEGVLHVTVPPVDVRGERLLHLAVDGSLYDVHDDAGVRDMPERDGALGLDPAARRSTGPGPAWPPLPAESEPRMLARVPGAPGRGPAVLHGARPLQRLASGLTGIAPGTACALAFAARLERPGGPEYRPFQRLAWTGDDPRTATWEALGADGEAVPPAQVASELAAVARLRAGDPEGVALAARFECADDDATLCPGEVAWTTDAGDAVLIHLPQLDAAPPAAGEPWPLAASYAGASEPVRVAEDGSTWAATSTANRRMALGAVAPIAGAAGLRRRRVRRRRLCAWDNEDWTASPPRTLAPTSPGGLDIDVANGLFAFAAEEPPQAWPPGPAPGDPPSVTTDQREGATMHIGARPDVRAPLLEMQLPRPTRLVSRSGALHPEAPADWHEIPRYPTLTAALAAVSAAWQALGSGEAPGAEVVQFEDSATYVGEAPVWPDAVATAAGRLSLTIQAAERQRPVVLMDPAAEWSLPPSAPAYAELVLRGIALGGAGWEGMDLPPARAVALQLCTVLDAANVLRFGDVPEGVSVGVTRCETAGLVLEGPGLLAVADSIVDAHPEEALRAAQGDVALERVSVRGETRVRVLQASEVIFDGRVEVADRFHGCVRFSRVTADSVLPRAHRVATGTPVRVVSRNRHDAAWWRLRADCDPAISRGAENGSEMGAFSATMLAGRMAGFARRLAEFSPAGLVTGIVRID